MGDSQSAMAAGRALGPAIGGLVVGDGSFGTIAIIAVFGLVAASGLVFGVERYREGKKPPGGAGQGGVNRSPERDASAYVV